MTNYNFSSKFKYANILSLTLFLISIVLIIFKGLNYGIDFKGGTLIELRSNNIDVTSVRNILKKMEFIEVSKLRTGGLIFSIIGFIIIYLAKI